MRESGIGYNRPGKHFIHRVTQLSDLRVLDANILQLIRVRFPKTLESL